MAFRENDRISSAYTKRSKEMTQCDGIYVVMP